VARVIRELSDAKTLPHEGDEDVIIPPVGRAFARIVPREGLELLYTFTGNELVLRGVRVLPVRLPE